MPADSRTHLPHFAKRLRLVVALALVGPCSTALAQQPAVSLEAESVSLNLQGGGSVYTGLTLTDGVVTIDAAEGVNTSANEGLWELRGLRIALETVTLTADTGTLRLAGGKVAELELIGGPATLDGTVGGDSRQLRLTAGRIAYDAARRVLRVSESAVFASDGLEVRDCSWTYDLSDKSVEAIPEGTSKCVATVTLDTGSEE